MALLLAAGLVQPAVFTADAAPSGGLVEFGDEHADLRDAPTPDATVTARIGRDAADEIRLVRVRVVTRAAGAMRSLADEAVVRGADHGTRTHVPLAPSGAVIPVAVVPIEVGREVAYLQDSPGGCYVAIDRRVVDATPCPTGDPHFLVEREPVVEWWGFLHLSDGRSGWILIARHGPS